MSLTEDELDRLADVVRLQPTKNGELQERWGMESGSEVHHYLEDNLGEYYYRDEDSLIRATPEAAELTGVDPGVEGDGDGDPNVLRVPELQARVFESAPGPEERSASVVAVLESVRADHEFEAEPGAEDVRGALQSLKRKGVVEVVYRTVPTFRLAVDRAAVDVETLED
ncbi:MAG: DUF5797 family protein [Halolamina sp.]